MTQPSQSSSVPVVLELAPLPREQAGPFLLLGVPKTATPEQIEEQWARRVIWTRKKQAKMPLEDVNWARECLNDQDRRLGADASSLNIDTQEMMLYQLESRTALPFGAGAGSQPLDVEKDLSGYNPEVEIPDLEEIRRAIQVPEVPREFPAVRELLEQFAREPLDPWNLERTELDE